MVFSFSSIMISIEIPQLYPELYHFDSQQVGLQFISLIVGSLMGEVIGGVLSDRWMAIQKRKTGDDAEPEFRLWLSYVAYLLSIIGTAIFLVLFRTTGSKWTIGPDIGAVIAAVGNQIATTVLITYAVDCLSAGCCQRWSVHHLDTSNLGLRRAVLVSQVRRKHNRKLADSIFRFPLMIENAGLNGAAGIQTALTAGVCFPASVLLQWMGKSWR